ncbi:MAG: Ig-like domain-containing protein [Bacteroidales bacterium]|nr:Ig-like domain-containing protein [Bacteroidales bacterium]
MGKIKYILLFPALFLLTQCANVVAPTGGAKDITPPKVSEAVPANRSTGFNGKKIEITFDEFVTLNNANQNVLFSPLLGVKPDIKLNGKTVVIKFKESLQPNTTYTIDFGDAIKDLHEGNLFKDYVYSFSTGDRLDTLTLAGKVLNADDQKPVADCFVTLYDSERDSLFDLPTRHAPDFITKTDKDGMFNFHGLPGKSFLVFALNDVNANYYYDMPNEKVAFIDTLVNTVTDSISNSINQNLILYAFTVVDTTQMLLEKKLVEDGLLRFVFRQPARDVNIITPSVLDESFRIVEVWSKKSDTLWWYFTPNVMDSLRVNIQYDTLINESTVFSLKYKDTKQRPSKTTSTLKVSNNLRNNMLMPGEDFILRFTEPIIEIAQNPLVFEKADDYGMAYRLLTPLGDTASCTFNLPDSVFFSIRGRTNDSISVRFKNAIEKDLGNLFITVVPPENTQVVVQLLNSRKAVVDQKTIDSATRVEFRQLLPEKYQVKAILDSDRNGQWSTGNFHKRFLPETILEYKDVLEVKAGWDIDLDDPWELK